MNALLQRIEAEQNGQNLQNANSGMSEITNPPKLSKTDARKAQLAQARARKKEIEQERKEKRKAPEIETNPEYKLFENYVKHKKVMELEGELNSFKASLYTPQRSLEDKSLICDLEYDPEAGYFTKVAKAVAVGAALLLLSWYGPEHLTPKIVNDQNKKE